MSFVLRAYTPITATTDDCDCAPDPVTTRHGTIHGFLHTTACPITDKAKGWNR